MRPQQPSLGLRNFPLTSFKHIQFRRYLRETALTVLSESAHARETDEITVNRQVGFNNYFRYTNLRSDDPGQRTFAPWNNSTRQFPDCNGTTPWDRNTGDPSGAGYRCLDQPGSGTSAYLQDVDPPPAIKANNAREPIYIWNNTVNGQPDNCGNFGCNSDGVVKVGRDVFIGQARPGYTAFTYPHPLVGAASAAPPAAPGGVRLQ